MLFSISIHATSAQAYAYPIQTIEPTSPEAWQKAFRESSMNLEDFKAHTSNSITPQELETLLPPGISIERAAGKWFDQEQGMYYYPVLGLFFCPNRNMWHDYYWNTWYQAEYMSFFYDLPYGDPSDWVDCNEVFYTTDSENMIIFEEFDVIITGDGYNDEIINTEYGDNDEVIGEVFNFSDLPYSNEKWQEDDVNFPDVHFHNEIIEIMPLNAPSLIVSLGTITSESVILTGILSNPGNANITARGFWIRRSDQTSHREVLVSSSSNTFNGTITGLTADSTYHVRAVARASGTTGTLQSPARTFVTPSNQQQGNLTISPTSWSAPHTASNRTITVNSNRTWSIASTSSWLTTSQTSGSNNGSFNVNASANTTTTTRTGAITVSAPGLPTRTVSVTQAAATSAANPTVTVQANTVTSTAVTLVGTINNPGGATITSRGFWIREGNESNHREYTVSATGNQFSRTITGLSSATTYHVRAIIRTSDTSGVIQSTAISFTTPQEQGGVNLNLNRSTWNPDRTTSSISVSVTSNRSWTVSSSAPAWLSVSPSSGSNNGTFTINVTANNNTSSRSGTITVTAAGNVTRTVVVTQSGTVAQSTPVPTSPPTPTPVPVLSFNPSGVAPWNLAAWVTGPGQNTTTATVVANNSWNWSGGSAGWLTVTGFGVSGTQLSISTQPNDSGVRRTATVTVTSANLTRNLTITQNPVMATVMGQRVIECFGRNGYVDVRGNATSATIECVSRSSAERPIWNFVHIQDNVFAIRNETTRHYFTETDGNLQHEARLSGSGTDYSNRQRWILSRQSDGTYRIRSVSRNTLYVQEGVNHILNNPNLSLASRSNSNRQLWRIGYIWHVDRRYDNNQILGNIVGFWDRDINIWVEPIGPEPAGFNFRNRMNIARNAWVDALDIRFNNADNAGVANIRAYGGHRNEIQARLRYELPQTAYNYRYGVAVLQGTIDMPVGTIEAGGATRHVNRLNGTGRQAAIMLVFSDSASWHIDDSRIINFATMTAMQELGHALGYFGHSSNSNDVMARTTSSSPNVRLNPAEIEHLRQIYRNPRFRN